MAADIFAGAPGLWVASFALHSLVLLSVSLLLSRSRRLSLTLREAICRCALVGALCTVVLGTSLGALRITAPAENHVEPVVLAPQPAISQPVLLPDRGAAGRAEAEAGASARSRDAQAGGGVHAPAPHSSEAARSRDATDARVDPLLFVLLLWGAGFVVLVVQELRRRRALHGLLARARRIEDPAFHELLRQVAKRDADEVVPLELAGLASPFVIGWRRPRLVLDLDAFWSLSTESRELLLRHELAHVRRRDPLWLGLGRWLSWLLWPIPAYALLSRRLAQIAELRCDELAALGTRERISLARLLVDLAERRGTRVPALVSAMAPGQSELHRRVRSLLAPESSRAVAMPRLLALVPMLLVAGLTPVFEQAGPAGLRERGTLRGIVRLHDGKPWKNAEVVLVGRIVPGIAAFGELDEIRVRCDDAGRFTAKVLRDRSYSVWAQEVLVPASGKTVEAAMADGGPVAGGLTDFWRHLERSLARERRRVSPIVEGAVASDVLRLTGEEDPRAASLVRVRYREPWLERGALHATLLTDAATYQEAKLRLDGDVLVVPPFVGKSAVLSVRDHRGMTLAAEICSGGKRIEAPIDLAPPKAYRFRLFDAVTKDPVVGAELHVGPSRRLRVPINKSLWKHTRNGGFVQVGRSDEQGRVTLHLPAGEEGALPTFLDVQARAPGHAVHQAGLLRVESADEDGTLRMPMEKGVTVEGRLRVDEQTVAGGVPLLVSARSAVQTGEHSSSIFDVPSWIVQSDAEGRFRVENLHPKEILRLWAVASRLPESAGALRSRGALLLHDGRASSVFRVGLDLQLDRFVPVDISVVTRAGVPARSPVLHLLPHSSAKFDPSNAPDLRVPGGRRGRIRTLLPRRKVGLLVVAGSSFAVLDLDPGDREAVEIELRVDPMLVAEGVVRDAQDEVLVGAQVWICGNESENATAQMHALAGFNLRNARAVSGAQGKFRLHFLPVPRHVQKIRASKAGKWSDTQTLLEESALGMRFSVPVK